MNDINTFQHGLTSKIGWHHLARGTPPARSQASPLMPVDWDITVNGTRLTLEQAETLRHALRMIREPFRIHVRKEEYERLCEVLVLLALKP
jgi:hypothetical protein